MIFLILFIIDSLISFFKFIYLLNFIYLILEKKNYVYPFILMFVFLNNFFKWNLKKLECLYFWVF